MLSDLSFVCVQGVMLQICRKQDGDLKVVAFAEVPSLAIIRISVYWVGFSHCTRWQWNYPLSSLGSLFFGKGPSLHIGSSVLC